MNLFPPYLNKTSLNLFISSAFKEDIESGDHTSLACIPKEAKSRARLLVKSDGIIAGVAMAKMILKHWDNDLEIETFINDGEKIIVGDIAFTVHGSSRSILSAERLLLNCMQRMSGIASYTHNLNSLISHTNTKLLDTRKTTPNFRLMEKWAVYIGGGVNHRYGLYDAMMIKDNHIDFAGGVSKAIKNAKEYLKEKEFNLPIIIETRDLDEVKEVLKIGGITRILLDNMPPKVLREAIEIIKGEFPTEASGGITEKTITEVAETGVDFISVGALTHSFTSLDLSLKAY